MHQADTLQALRPHDPAAALAQARQQRGQWPPLPAAEDALLQARYALQIGSALMMLGELAQARQTLDEVDHWLAAPALQGAADALLQQARRCATAAANARAAVAHGLGDLAGALRAYLQALEMARCNGEQRFEAHVLTNVACTFEASGLPAEALAHLQQALRIAQALGLLELEGDIHHNMGNALAASGHLAQGLASNAHALEVYTSLALPQKQACALVALAERHLELGRYADATQALLQRASLRGSFVDRAYEAYTAHLHGRIAAAQGQAAAARAAFVAALSQTAGPLDDALGQARSRIELARLDMAAGQAADAQAQAQAALALLEGSSALPELMRAHELLGQVAKAQGLHSLALQHVEAFHALYAQCFNETSARRASVLAVQHEVALARAEAQRQRLENARLTEALAEIAAHLDQGPGRRAAAPVQPRELQALGLTAREAEVLFWVAQGKTNEDVALLLGTSMSAVKKHLVRVFDKLGVENRTAAASAARRLLD
jgi:ATP/maltotriose-dependent transcriptional regulator MalT